MRQIYNGIDSVGGGWGEQRERADEREAELW